MKRSLLFLSLLFVCLDAHAQVPWVETKFPGAAPIKAPITHIEADQNGAIYGIVSETPARVARSTDRGESWSYHPLPLGTVGGFERLGDRFYISIGNRILWSDDLVDWSELSPALSAPILSANKGILIATNTSATAYKATPSSEFIRLPDSVTQGVSYIAPKGSEFVYCLSTSGLWRSPIGSTQWTKLSDGYDDSIKLRDITIVGDSLFVAAEHAGNGRPILYSSNLNSLRLTEMMIEGGLLFRELFTFRDSVLVAVRYDRTAPIHDLNYSIDLKQLTPVPARPTNTINDVAPQGGRLWLVSNDGIWWNDDLFFNWQKASRRLEANWIMHLQAIPPKTVIAITSRGNLMATTDGGESWEDRYSFGKAVNMIGYSPNGTLFVGQQGQLLASQNEGRSFIGTSGFEDRTIQAFAVGKDNKLFLGTDSGLFFSTNDGETWFRPKSFLMNIMTGINELPEVYSIAFLRRNNGMYVGTNAGVIYSLNEGDKYEGGWLRKTPVMALAVNRYGEAFAGSWSISAADPNRRNFYRGWDVLWQNPAWIGTDTSIEDYDMQHIMLNSRDQLISGMLFSINSGDSWERGQIEGLGSPTRFNAQALDEDDIAYVAVNERLFKSGDAKLVAPRNEKPGTHLSIYPNPASTELRVATNERGDVSILNALGETMLIHSIEPGTSIDISRLPAGSYHCQIRTNTGVERAPFIVVR